MLDFLPGERFKFIPVTIVDNNVPELDKVFRVELYNPDGGGQICETRTRASCFNIVLVHFYNKNIKRDPELVETQTDLSAELTVTLPNCFCVSCVPCSCVLPHTLLKL